MIRKLITIIAIFILAFNPELFGYNLMHILTFFSLGYIIINVRNIFNFLLGAKGVFIYLCIMVVIVVHLSLTTLLHGTSINDLLGVFYLLFEVVPVSVFIIFINLNEKGLNCKQILESIVIASMLQSIIALLSFFIPSIQLFFINQLLLSNYSNIFAQLTEHRMYGFSSLLTFATPALQSIIAVLLFYKSKHPVIIRIILIGLITFSAVINARTSLVILVLGVVLYITFNNRNFFTISISTILFTIFIFTKNIAQNLLLHYRGSNQSIKWIIDGYNEIILFLFNDTSIGFFNYLDNDSILTLPKGLDFFIGTGERVMGQISDIGYVNDFWLGGFVYIFMFYGLILYMIVICHKFLKTENIMNYNLITFFILISLILLNVKGFIFNFNGVMNLFVFVYFCINYQNYINNKIRRKHSV